MGMAASGEIRSSPGGIESAPVGHLGASKSLLFLKGFDSQQGQERELRTKQPSPWAGAHMWGRGGRTGGA